MKCFLICTLNGTSQVEDSRLILRELRSHWMISIFIPKKTGEPKSVRILQRSYKVVYLDVVKIMLEIFFGGHCCIDSLCSF